MRRRRWLQAGAGLATLPLAGPSVAATPRPARLELPLRFARDHGSHPDTRTEWWYITGHARAGEREFGFQITFFRSRVDATQGMRSAFAARQLIFAHAAITDVAGKRLWHDQRIARAGFGIAQALEGDMGLRLRDWSLVREGEGLRARAAGTELGMNLQFEPTQPVLLQGDQGLSRKGPEAAQASLYYSWPQLRTRGRLTLGGQTVEVEGMAWLDHEWSEELLHPQAVGWDWIGMNLDDGSAVTAFRLRRKDGTALWDGGSFRSPGAGVYIFSKGETVFSPQRRWTSPRTQASYPVEWIVRTPADFYTVKAVVDDQELDSRASTGTIYWEGLSDLLDSNGKRVGRGYLEMTGYSQRLRI